jgi:alanyl-tRNA synthetase
LKEKRETIVKVIEDEELKFNKTVENALRELDRLLDSKQEVDGIKAFQFYETYGLPIEVTEEILQEKGLKIVNREKYEEAEKQHQEKSRTASKGFFKGGLADTSEMSTKYHTATHLLLASLRKVVGEHIHQLGSNITTERLRLDFPNKEKLTEEQLKKVEDMVNEVIENNLDISFEEMNKEDALATIQKYSSTASFDDRYGDVLKVYYIGPKDSPFSVEICNGPHVSNTKELGKFKIIKQENIGAGIKRIKAILE